MKRGLSVRFLSKVSEARPLRRRNLVEHSVPVRALNLIVSSPHHTRGFRSSGDIDLLDPKTWRRTHCVCTRCGRALGLGACTWTQCVRLSACTRTRCVHLDSVRALGLGACTRTRCVRACALVRALGLSACASVRAGAGAVPELERVRSGCGAGVGAGAERAERCERVEWCERAV
jgi:hypothetical protein